MNILISILELLDLEMTEPQMYGAFHIIWLIITVAASVALCLAFKGHTEKTSRKIVFYTAILVTVLEIYKQINYTFKVTDGEIVADFQWYAFPFQFCSIPMYAGLLCGIVRSDRIRRALYAFLATYGLFAGVCVMLYPSTVFIDTIGINIQTMVCHGSMIVIGVYLLYSKCIELKHKTMLYALSVFSVAVGIAALLNEIVYRTGIAGDETFNMFFISPYFEPSLPVYSIVQQHVPFPLCTLIYIAVFTAVSYVLLLLAMAADHVVSAYRISKKSKISV